MTRLPIGTEQSLHNADLYLLEDGISQWVGCESGVVWISQKAEPRDIVLKAGDSVLIEAPHDTIVGPIGGPAVMWTDAAWEIASAA